MTEATPVLQIHPAENAEDALTSLLREGAQRLLAEALQAEVEEYLDRFRSVVDTDGKRRVVRNGTLPERNVQTGVGTLTVNQPRVRVRDRGEGDEELKFESKLIPPYLRKTKSIENLIPWLYLRGISTNDMAETMSALLDVRAEGFSPTSVVRGPMQEGLGG